jgi:hypothetical protein
LSIEVAFFLAGKGVFETMDDFSFIRLYDFEEKPSLLPFYMLDKFFVIEVCKQYNFWAHFFNEKKKVLHSISLENWGNYYKKTFPTYMNLLRILIVSD